MALYVLELYFIKNILKFEISRYRNTNVLNGTEIPFSETFCSELRLLSMIIFFQYNHAQQCCYIKCYSQTSCLHFEWIGHIFQNFSSQASFRLPIFFSCLKKWTRSFKTYLFKFGTKLNYNKSMIIFKYFSLVLSFTWQNV